MQPPSNSTHTHAALTSIHYLLPCPLQPLVPFLQDNIETSVTVATSFHERAQAQQIVLTLKQIFERFVFFNFDIHSKFTFKGDDAQFATLRGPSTRQLRKASFTHTFFIDDRAWITILLGTQHAFGNSNGAPSSLQAGELHLQFHLVCSAHIARIFFVRYCFRQMIQGLMCLSIKYVLC